MTALGRHERRKMTPPQAETTKRRSNTMMKVGQALAKPTMAVMLMTRAKTMAMKRMVTMSLSSCKGGSLPWTDDLTWR